MEIDAWGIIDDELAAAQVARRQGIADVARFAERLRDAESSIRRPLGWRRRAIVAWQAGGSTHGRPAPTRPSRRARARRACTPVPSLRGTWDHGPGGGAALPGDRVGITRPPDEVKGTA